MNIKCKYELTSIKLSYCNEQWQTTHPWIISYHFENKTKINGMKMADDYGVKYFKTKEAALTWLMYYKIDTRDKPIPNSDTINFRGSNNEY